MRKDYAKTKTKNQPKKRYRGKAKGSTLEGKLWLLACVLIGLFILGLFYLKKEEAKLAKKSLPTAVTSATAATKSSITTPRFDFYTMLPSGKVNTTSIASITSATTPAKVAIPVTARDQVALLTKQQLEETSQETPRPHPLGLFILQLGLFKNFSLADEQKAQLVLLGIEAKVKTIKKNGVWYQVWLGPYKSSAQAQKMQQKLKANQIKSVVIKENLA